MAYGADVWRMTASGTLGTGEIFDHGFWGTSFSGSATASDVLDALHDGVSAFWASTVSSVPGASTMVDTITTEVVYTQIEVRPYVLATGLPSALSTVRTISITGSQAGSSTLPYECGIALSLDSGIAGRTRWNRTFLPPMWNSVTGTDGHLALGFTTDLGDALAAWNDASKLMGVALAVYSKHDHTILEPADAPIGDVMDSQRRRRNNLVEAREHTTVDWS